MTPTEIAHAIMGPMAEKAFKRAEQLTVDEAQKLMCLLGTYKLALETVCVDAAKAELSAHPNSDDGINNRGAAFAEMARKAGYDATNEALLQAEALLIEMGQVNLVGARRGIHVVN